METHIYTSLIKTWHPQDMTDHATAALESGKVVYCPNLPFLLTPEEQLLLTPDLLDGSSKNISFNPENDSLKGTNLVDSPLAVLQNMMWRFSLDAMQLAQHLFPHYKKNLRLKRTSYRPAEIKGRKTSWRKDDTRLHVDAFPSTPNQGRRLLRLFSNIHTSMPRIWRLGQPFQDMAAQFLPTASKPFPFSHSLLKILGVTKKKRTLYDHYMLHFHDQMKKDLKYQKNVPQISFDFPAQTTWAVFTDQASHAAMSGQFLLEQTFELPPECMLDQKTSPQHVLQKLLPHQRIA